MTLDVLNFEAKYKTVSTFEVKYRHTKICSQHFKRQPRQSDPDKEKANNEGFTDDFPQGESVVNASSFLTLAELCEQQSRTSGLHVLPRSSSEADCLQLATHKNEGYQIEGNEVEAVEV